MSFSPSLYAGLAGFYDRFCAGVDYAEQSRFALRVFRAFAATKGNDYLDLACGTGQLLQAMHSHGCTLYGLDNSAAMLEQAQQRCPQAQLQHCDMSEIQQDASFDLITCFLYSLHYSHPTAQVQKTLARCFAALKPGGVLVFNAVDASGVQNDEGITTWLTEGTETYSFRSAWHYRGEGEVLDLNLFITRESAEGKQQWQDHHTMTALHFPALQAMLRDVGFVVEVLEHDYSLMQPWQGQSFNAIFVACRPT